MRDLVGNLMILCVKYIELNCEERLEENLGDIVLCIGSHQLVAGVRLRLIICVLSC